MMYTKKVVFIFQFQYLYQEVYMNIKNRRGFTLVEVIVVAGIIAILAGILVPLIFNQIDESRITRAQGDMKALQTAILSFRKDTGSWPDRIAPGTAGVTLLHSESTSTATPPIPTVSGINWDTSESHRIVNHLRINDNNVYDVAMWKGPYISSADADPWGNAYIINADQFKATGPVWIISAGPDGIVTTDARSEICFDKNYGGGGDDICLRLR